MKVLNHLLKVVADKGAGFLTLLDPGDQPKSKLIECAQKAEEGGVDAILIGGSQIVA
jgi:heptaprenylglyceryl phosphate synthase